MKTYFAIACFLFTAIGLAWGQSMFLLLYKDAAPDGRYVLVISRGCGGDVNSSISDVITSDSFAVQPDGSVYMVTFTNAARFHAEIAVVPSPSVRTNFVQATFPGPIVRIGFPTNTPVLFNNLMTDLGHIQAGEVSSNSKVDFQDEATNPQQSKNFSVIVAVYRMIPGAITNDAIGNKAFSTLRQQGIEAGGAGNAGWMNIEVDLSKAERARKILHKMMSRLGSDAALTSFRVIDQ